MNVVTAIRPDTGHHSLEAEQQLLGALLMNDRLTPIVMRAGGAELFYHPLHAEIYDLIETRANRGDLVSPLTLKADLQGSRDLEEVGGPAYLTRMLSNALSGRRDVVQGIAEMLAEHARKRALTAAISEAQVGLLRGDTPARDIALQLERQIVAAEFASQADRPTSMLAAVTEAIAQSVEAYQGNNDDLVRFGIPALDDIIPGLYPGELTLLGGRPAMGKSAVALTMALNAARAGHGVAIASLEMTPAAMAQRALSEATARDGRAVPYVNMRSGDMTEDEMRAVVELGRSVGNLPITFLSRSYSNVDALVGGVRQIARATPNLRLLIVDYAQLLKAQGKDRYQQVTNISLALKGMAMSLNIPVLALSQLSRSIESREDKRPVLSDLRESGQLEQDADSVLFCYRPEYYLAQEEPDQDDQDEYADWLLDMEAARGKLEIGVAKQRMGQTGTARCRCALSTNTVWSE
ncbi:replicative DNA helicase [Paracoccus marcusii]|uniref:replicative DNA helicase n=1 Tax=Paracoccus marcusii TaxID=59779 RepID=UPI001111E892|nr:DnaB-like helicase C-terminal domain-containing protein [Paracoccus marcusii]TNC05538.1 replicative DNA helicase [Paracoccus marcusii]